MPTAEHTDRASAHPAEQPIALSPGRHAPDHIARLPTAPDLDNAFTRTRRLRVDGWTSERRAAFLAALAEHGVVTAACRETGMSASGAHALRSRDRRFADGWHAACLLAGPRLADELLDRSVNGCIEQIWRDGCIVGERHRYDNRLSMAVLNRLDARCDRAERNGTRAQRLVEAWDDYLLATAEGRTADADAIAEPPPPPPSPELPAGTVLGVGDLSTLHRQLIQLRSGRALDETGDEAGNETGEQAEPLPSEDRVWSVEGVWRTDFPAPPGFEGFVDGFEGDADYQRDCTPEECAALDAYFGPPGEEEAEALADEEAARDTFFAACAQAGAEADEDADCADTGIGDPGENQAPSS